MARVSQCVISWPEIEANINQRHLAALGGETLTRTEQIYSVVSVCQWNEMTVKTHHNRIYRDVHFFVRSVVHSTQRIEVDQPLRLLNVWPLIAEFMACIAINKRFRFIRLMANLWMDKFYVYF